MIIHLSLYPRFQPAVHLTIKYVPAMDHAEIKGIWDIDKNYVALDWQLFKEFFQIEKQSEKQKFFNRLHKVSQMALPQ